MKNHKLNSTVFKFTCIVLAFVLLFASVQILAAELGGYVATAFADTGESTQATSGVNDLTSDSSLVYLPNYDTSVITKQNLRKPRIKTFGEHEASYYPSYTNQLAAADFDDAKKAAILAENQKMLADVKEWYAAGTLKDNLKKHVSADGQFSNAVGNYNKAKRIEKVVTINNVATPRKRSLGVFAPAGEVLTITIDESLVGKLTVNIGYPYSASDIGSKQFGRWPNDRMAQFYLEFPLNSTVNYIGSPLGGMVTLNGVAAALGNFDIKVSGGIDMPDYKLGASTKEDWQAILAAPAPYVWLLTPHQYFVMPKEYIKDIEDPYQALLWWHKASMISMYSIGRENTSHFMTPVISIYDSYVFTGEAVATVWAFYTNSPNYWCKGILDYDNLMYSGAWGGLHEYNHHNQAYVYPTNHDTEWGVGGVTEMTNNVLNAICYIALTDIALERSETNIFNGWAAVSDPYSNYRRLSNKSASVSGYEAFQTDKLFGFVDLMHTYGADKFMQFVRAMYGLVKVDGYDGTNLTQDTYLKTQDGFALFASLFYRTDFVDYFTKVWHFNISADVVNKIKSYNFDEYFSINNLYSAGVKGVETGRAYKVNEGETTLFRFDRFTLSSADNFVLESVSEPKHGKLTNNHDGTYSYLPDSGFTEDSMDLVYKVMLNGKTYTRTLAVKLTNAANAQEEREAASKIYPSYVDFRNKFLSNFYSDVIRYIPSEAKCVDNDGNEVKTVPNADIYAMFDGNTSTGFHTAWQGTLTKYPHNYYFTFDEATNFNRINFKFQDNGTKGYYAIGEYEIYTSEDGVNYELLTSGKNQETNFSVQFDTFVSTKYVKLVVKSNSSGKGFTNITELEFAQSISMGDDYNVYSSSDSSLNYSWKWKSVVGNYLNSQAKRVNTGKVKFYLTGTDLMLYSTNAKSKITIDGVTYTIRENSTDHSPSFVIDGLSEGKHLVVIDAKDMSLDMIKTTGVVSYAKGRFVNWAGLGVAIALAVAFAGVGIYCIVVTVKQRKKSS